MQRSYTQEFLVNAVNLAKEIGQSSASKQLKISLGTLNTWVNRDKRGELKQYESNLHSKNLITTDKEKLKKMEQEYKMLKTENIQLKEENKILEDAASFFAARRKK